MALPKLDVPIYTMTLLSDNRDIRYRPFLVKEEKILFMALEGNNSDEMTLAMKQIVNNCVQDPIDIDKIPLFDIEYILLNVRAKSVSDKSNVLYPCDKCEEQTPIVIDLNEVKPTSKPKGKQDIQLSNTVGITLNYPKVDMASIASSTDSELEMIWKIIEACTEQIYDETDVYDLKNYTETERKDFFEALTQEQFFKIRDFFDDMPRLQYTTEYTCDNCNYSGNIVIEGLANFFD